MKHLPQKLNDPFDSNKIDAAKGILILLIILGHASNFWNPEPYITFSLKFFHVAAFLLLPFIYDTQPITLHYMKERLARYYIPFAFFTIIYGIGYLIVFRGAGDIAAWLYDLAAALTNANAPALDTATGLRALWFIPTLISITTLNAALIGRLKIPILILLPAAIALHIAASMTSDTLKFQIPFGLTIAAYLLPLGIIIRTIAAHTKQNSLEKAAPIFAVITILSITAAYYAASIIKFPIIHLPAPSNPIGMMIHPVIIIASFLFLTTTPWFKNIAPLKWLGQNSLTLYLTHLPFLAITSILLEKMVAHDTITIASSIAAAAIFAVALTGSILCALTLNKYKKLKSLIMPRNWQDWPPAQIFTARKPPQ